MALYALASAKGSPGVSIATMALAGTWPTDPVVADLDPAGGDFTWRYRTVTDEPVDTDRGLLSLGGGPSRRRGGRPRGPPPGDRGGVRVLAGIASPTQVAGLGAAWGQLPAVFRAADHDVLADCGRVVPGSAVTPVLLPTPCCSSSRPRSRARRTCGSGSRGWPTSSASGRPTACRWGSRS